MYDAGKSDIGTISTTYPVGNLLEDVHVGHKAITESGYVNQMYVLSLILE